MISSTNADIRRASAKICCENEGMGCIVACVQIKPTGKESNVLSEKNQIHVKSHITKKTVDRENQAKENRLRTYCFI